MKFRGRSPGGALARGVVLAVLVAGCTPVEPVRQGVSAVVVCPRNTLEGIDVSVYQGTVDWAMVRGSGRVFAIARAAHGTAEDTVFARNWAAIRAAGMIRGAYLYWVPSQDAMTQADILVRRVGLLAPGDLPAVIDVEETGGLTPAALTSRLRAVIDRVAAGTGRPPIIYTGQYFWNTSVRSPDFLSSLLWVAQYGRTCPDLPNPWPRWAFWQYSSTGRVAGIRGNVDLDHFEGTMSDLRALAGYPVMDGGVDAGADSATDIRVSDVRADLTSDLTSDLPARDSAMDAAPTDAARDAATDLGRPQDATTADVSARDAPTDATARDVLADSAANDTAPAEDHPAPDATADVSVADVTATDVTATDATADVSTVDEAPEAAAPGGCGCATHRTNTLDFRAFAMMAMAAFVARRRQR